MQWNKKTKKIFPIVAVGTVGLCLGVYLLCTPLLPQQFSVMAGQSLTIPSIFPITATVPVQSSQTTVVEQDFFGDTVIYTQQQTAETQNLSVEYKLLGIIPVKQAEVSILPNLKLIPCGQTMGVKMMTNGVMVVGLSQVEQNGHPSTPALDAGIAQKDLILSMNGVHVRNIETLTQILEQSNGAPIQMEIQRGEDTFTTQLVPQWSDVDQQWKMGLWVRDSAAGIGTITFVDPETGFFGGLGHGICDVDTNQLMPLEEGLIQRSSVIRVVKGEQGSPGELQGEYGDIIGQLMSNSRYGIFGKIDFSQYTIEGEALPIALRSEVEVGPAQLLCSLEGEKVQAYSIEIVKMGNSDEKNLLIHVTDSELLEKTGGIVQGMSGSPIIQNGKIIGAVTHVLVDDPTRGYGILIENMLADAKQVYDMCSEESSTALFYINFPAKSEGWY